MPESASAHYFDSKNTHQHTYTDWKTSMTKRTKATAAVKGGFPVKWKPTAVGDEIEGTYKGFEIVESRRKKGERQFWASFHLELDADDGEEPVWRSFASAMCPGKMKFIPVGTYIWVKYIGPFTTDNGTADDFEITPASDATLYDHLEAKTAFEIGRERGMMPRLENDSDRTDGPALKREAGPDPMPY